MSKVLMLVMVAVLLGFCNTAGAGMLTLFQDDIEAQTLGEGLHLATVPIGRWWVDNTPGGNSGGIVSDDYARSGSQSIKAYRQVDPLILPQLNARGGVGEHEITNAGGSPLHFQVSWYGATSNDIPRIAVDVGGITGRAGRLIVTGAGEYRISGGASPDAFHVTDVYAEFGVWNTVEIISTPTEDVGGGYFAFTVDAYVTIGDGPRIELIKGLQGQSYVAPGNNDARMVIGCGTPPDGISSTVYYDDVLIQMIPEPASLLLLGLGSLVMLKRRR